MNGLEKKECNGYFTVEAALVMPVVLICYLLIIQLLIFIYERCIWEQNACRLPVWKEYVEGYVQMNPAAEEISEKEIFQYVLQCLNEEEAEKYFLGQEITAQIGIRGEIINVSRSILYPQFGNKKYEGLIARICPKPVEYIRTTALLEEKIKENWNENDEE